MSLLSDTIVKTCLPLIFLIESTKQMELKLDPRIFSQLNFISSKTPLFFLLIGSKTFGKRVEILTGNLL